MIIKERRCFNSGEFIYSHEESFCDSDISPECEEIGCAHYAVCDKCGEHYCGDSENGCPNGCDEIEEEDDNG